MITASSFPFEAPVCCCTRRGIAWAIPPRYEMRGVGMAATLQCDVPSHTHCCQMCALNWAGWHSLQGDCL